MANAGIEIRSQSGEEEVIEEEVEVGGKFSCEIPYANSLNRARVVLHLMCGLA